MSYGVLLICREELAEKIGKEFIRHGMPYIIKTGSIPDALPYLTAGKILLVVLDGELFRMEDRTQEAYFIRRIFPHRPIVVLVDRMPWEQLSEHEVALYYLVLVNSVIRTCVCAEDIALQCMALIRDYTRRPGQIQDTPPLVFPDLLIDSYSREVFCLGREIRLTRREFDLLFYMASNQNQALSHEQIYQRIWPNGDGLDVTGSIANQITELRRKLSPIGTALFKNIYDYGYKFVPPYIKSKLFSNEEIPRDQKTGLDISTESTDMIGGST